MLESVRIPCEADHLLQLKGSVILLYGPLMGQESVYLLMS